MANYELAKQKAEQILKENYVNSPPVRVDDIVKNYNLNVVEIEFEKFAFDGEIAGFIDMEQKTIYVNKKDSDSRKIFTIAHELGHYLLHKDELEKNPSYAILYRKPIGGETDDIEKEANCFAANLLVPKQFLDQYYKEEVDDETLANIFAVSKEVIGFRKAFIYGNANSR